MEPATPSFLPFLLVFYAFLKEVNVGEPYLYIYQTKYLNLTAEQLTGEVLPFTPYTYMVVMVPIFLLTDLLLYKPTMLMEVSGQIAYRAMLVFGTNVLSQIFGAMFYGITCASEVAFLSYIYAILKKDQHRKLTSWTRAGIMAGRTSGYLFAQLFLLCHFGTLFALNVIALVLPCIAFLVCLALPNVRWETMVERMLEAKDVISQEDSLAPERMPKTYCAYMHYRACKLCSDFTAIYRIGHIRKWSFWWAMTTCMSLQVTLLAQPLWGEAQQGQTEDEYMNGFAVAAYTSLAILAILAMNAWPLDWDKWGEVALVVISITDAALLLVASETGSIWVMYTCYVAYGALFQVMITIAQWNIALKMINESYGLVFGVNSFIATLLQSILTIVVTDANGLGLHVRLQYTIYAAIHILIAMIFIVSVMCTVGAYWLERKHIPALLPSEEMTMSEVASDLASQWNGLPPALS